MNGYILESKSIIESDIWNKPPLYFKVWHYLLLKAQFKQNGNLDRGQLFTSISEIAGACSYYVGYRKITPSKKEIWSILEFLRNPYERNDERDANGTMIETAKVTHGIIVTICNYNKYQDPTSYEGNTEGDNEKSTKELRNGRQGNNIKNEIRIKNEKNENNSISCQEIVDLYHEECPSLSKVVVLSDKRKSQIKARLKKYSMDDLRLAFQRAEKSDWLAGRTKKSDWKANFDWLINETNLIKVLEGTYDNHSGVDRTISDMQRIESDISQEDKERMEKLYE